MSVNLKNKDITHLADLTAHRVIEVVCAGFPPAALHQPSVKDHLLTVLLQRRHPHLLASTFALIEEQLGLLQLYGALGLTAHIN